MSITKHHTKGTKVNSTDQHSKTPRSATGLFVLLGSLFRRKGSGASKVSGGSGVSAVLSAAAALVFAIPATAGAYATPEPPPKFSAAPGLPDGRVYEQVSPANKHGNEAGASTTTVDSGALNHYGLVSADGNSVLFEGTGPMGENAAGESTSPWAASLDFVATRSGDCPHSAWCTRALIPAARQPLGQLGGVLVAAKYQYLDPSADLSGAMVAGVEGSLAPGAKPNCFGEIYLAGPDPFVAASWLSVPAAGFEDHVESCTGYSGVPVGGTPDFSTVYFTYPGTLLPEDKERVDGAWGFYENREGVLREAGVLPGGGVSPLGAVPAASGEGRAIAGNEVSSDGERAFFVSPDPAVCEPLGHVDCAAEPPELYVRETEGEGPAAHQKTALVSQDTLLPEAGGLAAEGAPDGVSGMLNPAFQGTPFAHLPSYVFVSPDGSQAFFQSTDALTAAAQAASPGSEAKTYDFDVETGTLTYLPGVSGQIVAVDSDGSSFAFVRPAAGTSPAELDLWSAGGEGGRVTPVSQLPGAGAGVSEARMSNDGSVLVFQTSASLSSFNSGGQEEIYRYDVSPNMLGCVSCAPAGVTSRGRASFSALHNGEIRYVDEGNAESPQYFVNQRGISANGDRVFFETPDSLVPQDVNGNNPELFCKEHEGKCAENGDVYEWENGVVYLISTGKGTRSSFFLDSSENGDDVFFATTQGLVPGDTDGGYDIYDARIPRPGDNPPAAAVPCEGAVCQGPPNVPAPLTPPASATFSGLGNPAPEETKSTTTKTTTKTVKCKKGFTKKNNKCVKNKKKKTKAKKASNKGRA
jgi:hypothetical protein